MSGKRVDVRCSFCGKKQDQVRKLVAGPGVFICDQCVALCYEIIESEPPTMPEPPESEGLPSPKKGWLPRWFRMGATQPV